MKICLEKHWWGIEWGHTGFFGLCWTSPKYWWPIYDNTWYDGPWRSIRLGPLALNW